MVMSDEEIETKERVFTRVELQEWATPVLAHFTKQKLNPLEALATLSFIEQYIEEEFGISMGGGLIGIKTEQGS
jgi:hypothetical protein